ncbi:hypothetical protein ACFQ1L_42970 [Phytohabitans flavus]|uniref:hypothetical protein n=1 Tax=Phytohabitans flavus TaxID=1076124 RepID=UPI0036258935
MVAARILTQPPDLTGLVPPLRELVERTLAKDPTARPTSRALLDLLLAAGPDRPPAVAAALARQPGLLVAAEEAQAATDQHPGHAVTAAAVPPELETVAAGPTELVTAPAVAPQPLSAPTQQVAPPPPAVPLPAHVPPPPILPPLAASVPAPVPPTVSSRSGSRWGRFANVAMALAVLVTSLTVAGISTGVLPFGGDGTPSGAAPSATAGSPTAPTSSTSPRASELVAQDPLTEPRLWQLRDDPTQLTTCTFEGALVITRDKQGPYRCPGPMDQLADFSMAVDVRLRSEGACAAMWFRFVAAAGYIVRICPEAFYVGTHGVGDGTTVRCCARWASRRRSRWTPRPASASRCRAAQSRWSGTASRSAPYRTRRSARAAWCSASTRRPRSTSRPSRSPSTTSRSAPSNARDIPRSASVVDRMLPRAPRRSAARWRSPRSPTSAARSAVQAPPGFLFPRAVELGAWPRPAARPRPWLRTGTLPLGPGRTNAPSSTAPEPRGWRRAAPGRRPPGASFRDRARGRVDGIEHRRYPADRGI